MKYLAISKVRGRKILTGIAVALLLTTAYCAVSMAGRPVRASDLNCLMVGAEDLPWEAILFELGTGSKAPETGMLWFSSHLPRFRQSWSGPPTGGGETLVTRSYGANIGLAVASSPEEAASIAVKAVHSAAVIVPEVTGNNRMLAFADRAWYGGNSSAGVVFTRGNVVASVHMSSKDGVDADALYALAARVGRKISAALAGSPEPAPILPPSAADMKVGLEGAWRAKNSGKLLGKLTSLALQHDDELPRSLPGKQLSKNNYLVPLSYLSGILGTKDNPKITGNTASVILAGTEVVFTKDTARARVGAGSVDLGSPVQFIGGHVFVPLSLIEKGLGKTITWRKSGGTIIAVLGTGRRD